jgi:hypothetical protein
LSDAIAAPARVAAPQEMGFDDNSAERQVPPQAAEPTGNLPQTAGGGAPAVTDYYDFGEDSGAGLEGVGISDQLTPFLGLLQALSPQCIKGKPEYDLSARPGMFINTALAALYDGDVGVEFIPVYREHVYTAWARNERWERLTDGAFRGVLPETDELVKRLVTEQGTFKALQHRNAENENVHLIEQFNLGIIYGAPSLEGGPPHRAIIPITSTKIGVYRRWMTRVLDIRYPDRVGVLRQPALFAHRWRLTAVPISNRKGDFFNYKFDLAVPGDSRASLMRLDDPRYAAAKEFYSLWAEGKVKADYTTGEAGAAEDSGDGGGASGDTYVPPQDYARARPAAGRDGGQIPF